MFRRLQSWTGTGFILVAASLLAAPSAVTVVQPVIDRPGSCAYCTVIEQAFEEASETIDLLLSTAELEENPLWEPLIDAHRRGVAVRLLLDESDWAPSITARNRPTLEMLQDEGIHARFDDPEVTTHAKLVIVDRRVVVLGSTNWNRYAFTDQEQANVRIVDDRVGDVFGTWFDELWEGRTGVTPQVEVGEAAATSGATIVPLPDSGGATSYAAALLDLLRAAERSVHVVLYRMSVYTGYSDSTANELSEALVRAGGRGLDVRVLIDDCRFYSDSASANLSAAIFLHERGIPVRFDDPEETTHAKLVIVDGEHVVVGSTNWNYYALERNVESNIALLGMPEIAAAYEAFFETLWREGRAIGTED